MKVFVIIPAAGLGTRMAAPAPAAGQKEGHRKDPTSKQFKDLAGVPILVRTLQKFAAVPAVSEIIVALRKDEIPGFQAHLEREYADIPRKQIRLVEGGEHRQNSVANALASLAAESGINPADIVLVHDAVRPLVTPEIIN